MIPFIKMHGLGNDYVYLDAVSDSAIERRRDLPRLARAMSDRHRGVGGDGIILVCRPRTRDAHVRMRIFNADGSEAQMCGNGVRCVAKLAHDHLSIRAKPLRVETGRGTLAIEYSAAGKGKAARLTTATVDMGAPILDLADVPVEEPHLAWHGVRHQHGVEISGHRFLASFVSMGNPHMVVFNRPDSLTRELSTSDLARLDLSELGPMLETHPAFPQRINVHFVAVESPARATMRTWERGSGITQACGTGACATLVAGVRTGRLKPSATITLPGGDLKIKWDQKRGSVFMTGPASEAYRGEWPD